MSEAAEQMFVEAFIMQSTIEAFDEPILCGLARLDAMPFDLALPLPLKYRIAGLFRAVVTDHQERVAAPFGDAVEFAHHSDAG